MQIEVKRLECKKCGYEWIPRKTDVRYCPKCKTTYWDIEREWKKKKEVKA